MSRKMRLDFGVSSCFEGQERWRLAKEASQLEIHLEHHPQKWPPSGLIRHEHVDSLIQLLKVEGDSTWEENDL